MRYKTDINERAFNAILTGTKTIEIRTNTPGDPINYSNIKPGDIMEFDTWPKPSQRKLCAIVKAIRHYSDTRRLFEIEGLDYTTSSKPNNIEIAIASIHRLTNYEQAVPKHGIYAIELKNPVLQSL